MEFKPIQCKDGNVVYSLYNLEEKSAELQQINEWLADPTNRMRAALIICESLMSCLNVLEGETFSLVSFSQRLAPQKDELSTCRNFDDLLKQLDILMIGILKPPEICSLYFHC